MYTTRSNVQNSAIAYAVYFLVCVLFRKNTIISLSCNNSLALVMDRVCVFCGVITSFLHDLDESQSTCVLVSSYYQKNKRKTLGNLVKNQTNLFRGNWGGGGGGVVF